MTEPSSGVHVREVRDYRGRRYRTGESSRDLMGRDRVWLLWLSWVALVAIGFLQYGFGAAAPALMARHGWTLTETFLLLAGWAVFQGGVAFPTAWLRARGLLNPAQAMVGGAVLCCVGLVIFAYAGGLPEAAFGYSLLTGTGAGLIYHTCTSTVAAWYPERQGTRTGFVSGAFAYGSLPVIVLFVLALDGNNLPMILATLGIGVLITVAVCGAFFREPPEDWWPAHIDPRQWALDRTLNPSRPANHPSLRQYSPVEAVRTPALVFLYLVLALAGAVSLFDIAYLAGSAAHSGFAPWLIVTATAVFVAANGISRVSASWASDRLGRRRTLRAVLAVAGPAQLGLLYAEHAHLAAPLVAFAALAGVTSGAFYPLVASLAVEYFGERDVLRNSALVYSAKVFGGLIGVGLGAVVVTSYGYAGAFLVFGVLALVATGLTRLLRQPGLLSTPSLPPAARPPAAQPPAGARKAPGPPE